MKEAYQPRLPRCSDNSQKKARHFGKKCRASGFLDSAAHRRPVKQAVSAARLNPRSRQYQRDLVGRSSDLRVFLLAGPSHPAGQWHRPAFVTDYSGGSVTELHRLPFYGPIGPPSKPLCTCQSRAIMNHAGWLSRGKGKILFGQARRTLGLPVAQNGRGCGGTDFNAR